MKHKKRFDCVAMKLRLQARHRADKARLGRSGFDAKWRRWREQSTDPLAVWWRQLAEVKTDA